MLRAILFPACSSKELGEIGSFAHIRRHFHRTTAATLTKLLGLTVKAIVFKLRADLRSVIPIVSCPHHLLIYSICSHSEMLENCGTNKLKQNWLQQQSGSVSLKIIHNLNEMQKVTDSEGERDRDRGRDRDGGRRMMRMRGY